jgi:tetratricopeptide (TPR) repeat protein
MDVYREAYNAFNGKKYTDAIPLLDKAIKLDFQCYECFHLRGQARSMLKTYRAAIADFDQALRLNQKGAWSYYERGCAYAAIEEHDFAKRDFELAIALLPNDPKTDLLYNHLGIALQNLARRYNHNRTLYERALQCFSEAIKRNPRNGYAYHRRGAVYQALGEIDRARADYDRAIPLLPPAEREWARRDKAGLTPSAPSKGGNGE